MNWMALTSDRRCASVSERLEVGFVMLKKLENSEVNAEAFVKEISVGSSMEIVEKAD